MTYQVPADNYIVIADDLSGCVTEMADGDKYHGEKAFASISCVELANLPSATFIRADEGTLDVLWFVDMHMFACAKAYAYLCSDKAGGNKTPNSE